MVIPHLEIHDLWKGKQEGGNTGGIPLQTLDGETGSLVDSVEECTKRVLFLLRNPEVSKRMGKAAHEHVRRHLLSTRHLSDHLKMFVELGKV